MNRMTPLNWEQYFVKQEIYLRERRKRWTIAGIGIVCILVVCVSLASVLLVKRRIAYENSEYAKVLREAENYKYDTVQKNIAEYLNQKYGAGTAAAEQINAFEWRPSGSGIEQIYKCFESTQNNDVNKIVYVVYLSDDKAVYFDNYQWPKIKEAIEAEALEKSGLDDSCARPAVQAEPTYEMLYRKSPWVLCPGAYHSYYDGNLQSFYDQEYEMRNKLAGTQTLMQSMRLNGTVSLFFADQQYANMNLRMTNPDLSYREAYEKALKEMEESYHLDILSCVLPGDYYQKLVSYYNSNPDGTIPNPVCYMDSGEGTGFFYSGYTLLSFAYDTLYKPVSE